MSDLRQAMQMALEALSLALSDVDWRADSPTQPVIHKAHAALRAALSAQQEPVAECSIYETSSGDHAVCRTCGETWETAKPRPCDRARALLSRIGHLHTMQPLTDEQINQLVVRHIDHGRGCILRVARAIERAHGIGGTHG